MSECVHSSRNISVIQTLDELDFERGIWFAAQHNDISRVEKLLKKNANINAEDRFGYTALHYASRNGHLELCKLLILNGADTNALTKCGKVSALHRSASTGHLQVFKLLLNSGASIDIKDGDGKTVLHRAIEGGNVDLIHEIIKIKPQLMHERDKKNKLPIEYCKLNQKIIDLFIDYQNV